MHPPGAEAGLEINVGPSANGRGFSVRADDFHEN